MTPFDLCSARVAIESGTVRAEELLDAQLAQARHAACRHAFVRLDDASARRSARWADEARAAGRRLPELAGLALSVKDLFDVEGQVTAAGSVVLADAPAAPADAPTVARLRATGAALIGRTQMTEFAFSGVGLNPHQGTPENVAMARLGLPGRIPGGSTSGGAVSVAAGAAWAALGTDTGGSIRIPAALHGLVGYKNSQALTPTGGAIPLSPSLDTACAITRTVRDAVLVHGILAQRQPAVDPARAGTVAALAGMRFGVAPNVGLDDLDPAVAQAFDAALQCLSQAGAVIEQRPLGALAESAPLLVNGGIVAAEAWRWHREHLARDGVRYDPRVASRIRRGQATDDEALTRLHRARAEWIAAVEAGMGPVDIWLMPTVPQLAPPIADLEATDEAFFRINALMLRNPALVNLLDGCAISLPCHRPGEAPVGLMLWSRRGLDDRLLAAALGVEAALQRGAVGQPQAVPA